METKDNIRTFAPKNTAAWRKWLEKHHTESEPVFLILYKKASATPSISWSEAVDEALCFGWIDSKTVTRDAESRYQYFCRRKPKGNWSKVNKDKVEQLQAQGRMMPAGLAVIENARTNGSWDNLTEVENLTVPSDLQMQFDANPKAFAHWETFPRSVKKMILHWVNDAKRAETRGKRITEVVTLANDGIRAR